MLNNNPIIATDGYKPSHAQQLPVGTKNISSYIEPRKGIHEVVTFGIEAFCQMYLTRQITQAHVDEAADFFARQGAPFDKELWERVVNEKNGYLPIRVQALPEGSVIPPSVPQVQITATDDGFAPIIGHLETSFLRGVWYPSTVATTSYHAVGIIRKWLEKTGTPELARFKLTDFGARGVSSSESAAIGGMAHLLNSDISDTMEGVYAAEKLHGAKIAFTTIPASEHSTMTSEGRENELERIENMIDTFGDGMFACVIDSYNQEKFIKDYCGILLRHKIDDLPNRGGTMVFRPDSGDPVKNPVQVINWLMDIFGYSVNGKAYKVLPDHIRVIQGDGINLKAIDKICEALEAEQISVDNIAFGMGGALLQGNDKQSMNRDTYGYAMKASEIIDANGDAKPVYKDPITDSRKASKKYRQAVIRTNDGSYSAIREKDLGGYENMLKDIFVDGKMVNGMTDWEIIKNRITTHESPYVVKAYEDEE